MVPHLTSGQSTLISFEAAVFGLRADTLLGLSLVPHSHHCMLSCRLALVPWQETQRNPKACLQGRLQKYRKSEDLLCLKKVTGGGTLLDWRGLHVSATSLAELSPQPISTEWPRMANLTRYLSFHKGIWFVV